MEKQEQPQPQQPTTAIANRPADQVLAERQEQAMSNVFGSALTAECHNFDGDVRRRWMMTAKACGADVLKLFELNGEAIEVRYYYAHRVEIVNPEDGEIIQGTRVVLITPDLKCYGCVSDGIARDLARIVATFGNRPFEPPIAVRMKAVKTRLGRTTYTLDPVL